MQKSTSTVNETGHKIKPGDSNGDSELDITHFAIVFSSVPAFEQTYWKRDYIDHIPWI